MQIVIGIVKKKNRMGPSPNTDVYYKYRWDTNYQESLRIYKLPRGEIPMVIHLSIFKKYSTISIHLKQIQNSIKV